MKLLDALRNATARVEADVKDSGLFSHMGERGEFRERVIESFLRPLLPKCYGLGSGEAFSADGSGSRQLDVVNYDDVFSNVLFRDSKTSIFPCESVYGVIEVKSKLDTRELVIAIENVRSLKELSRANSDMLDLLPARRLATGRGLAASKHVRNPYLGIVFTYDGLTSNATLAEVNRQLAEYGDKRMHLPDFIFNYRRGFSVMRAVTTEHGPKPVPPGKTFDAFVSVPTSTDTLPLFFLTVNVCLNQLYLRSPDLSAYWNAVLSSSLTRAEFLPDELDDEPMPPIRGK